ncbi:hypothetical protein AB0K09_32340, partial [Streptomyces sp. NPDC049577]|uniref:hypothetical protein n=1 Tax=Streptomyces sp. NPDC049577 TaxID=3155153 RepID=UPI00342B0105
RRARRSSGASGSTTSWCAPSSSRPLPKDGTVSGASGQGSDSSGHASPAARLTYTGARGTSAIDLTVNRLSPGLPADQQSGGCMPVQVRPYDECEARKLADGSMLYTTKSFTHPNSTAGQRRWYVELVTPDGGDLFLQEFGGGAEKESDSTAEPALSIDQLSAIVRSPAWKKAVDAVPVPAAPPTGGKPQVPGDRMVTLLASLLPGGTVTDRHGSPGFAELVYDDGKGRNMVQVNAQPGMKTVLAGHMDCSGETGACSSETLADGTRVKLTRGPSEKGGSAVVWIADTLRPDGYRVVVRECNSYAESGPVTRPEPAIGLDRLRAVALDAKWLP